MLGFDKNLYFLPFDHRSTFIEGLFSENKTPSQWELEQIKRLKEVIYEGFKKAVKNDIPRENAAILVDEQFGHNILANAIREGFITALTTEKSGQEEFDFEYGQEFKEHLDKFKPTFAKALVRYNPEGDRGINQRQLIRLKQLSDYCQQKGYKLLIEPLISATEQQLQSLENNKHRYELELRPKLAVKLIQDFQHAGVEVDIWKIEGFDQKGSYEHVVNTARQNGREHVGIIVLGRGGSDEMVEHWLTEGKGLPGVIGFAVGRTIFWEPIMEFTKGHIDGYQASEQIAAKFIHFYHIFTQ